MTIDWVGIKTSVANAMATAIQVEQSQAFAAFPMPSIPIAAIYTWVGTDIITTPDTSEVTTGDPGNPPPGGTTPMIPPSFIRLDSDGNWYEVIQIVAGVSIKVQDSYGVGGFPSGTSASSKSDGAVPEAPSSDVLKAKLVVPITNAVFDGVKDALAQAEITDVQDDPGNVSGPGIII